MNNKPTKLIEASKIRNKDRHPSQNELPPIDKFHPDWWYYRQEMEEPVEIDDNYKNESRHMNKKLIRLTESDLHRIVKESVKRVLKEDDTQNLGINNYDPTNYDELNMKIKAIMSKVSEIRNMIEDISTSQLDVAQNAGNLDGLAEELYRQLRYTLHKANTSNYIEA